MFNEADRTPVEVVKVFYPESAAGVASVQDRPDGRLVPNPATDRVQIEGLDVYQAWLLDAAGRQVAAFSGTEAALGIDVGGLPTGMYFIRVETRSGEEAVLRGVKG